MQGLDRFPATLRQYLVAFVARRRTLLALRALGWAAGIWLAWLSAACLVDRLLPLPEGVRWGNLITGVAILAAGVLVATWHLMRSVDWQRAAARIEGRTAVFDERLRTVTSQLLIADPGREGTSAAMLYQTVEQVQALLPAAPVRRLLPWRLALRPWSLSLGLAVVIAIGSRLPGWQVDRLLGRALFPERPIEAVTVTQLQVWPKGMRVPQGETVTVSASVTGARAAAVAQAHGMDLYLSADGKTWSRAAMNPTELAAQEARFEFVIPAIDRDLRYYVRGVASDAQSDIYSIRVHRVPAVAEFRIRYDYPDYANHAPVSVTNSDGSVECLTGSTATVTVVATEPLASATWVLNGDRLPMTRQGRPEEWQVSFPIGKVGNSAVEMTSAAGVSGRGPSPMPVRPIADQAPLPGVMQPSADVRLEPRDALLVRAAASDDYGLRSVDCQISVNGHLEAHAFIPVSGRPLRREGEFTLDLASLGVDVGDVVSVQVVAEDWWGQSQASEARAVLVSPHSVLPRSYERAAELRRAVGLARAWHEALNKARKALDAARASDPKTPARQDPWLAAGRAMSAAADAAAALRQPLMRAIARADEPALADALAGWADLTEAVLVEPGRPLSPASRSDEALSSRLNGLIARTRDLPAALDAVQQGERAAIAWREWQNHQVLAALPRVKATEPAAAQAADLRAKAIDHLRQTFDAQMRDLALPPTLAAADVERELRQRTDRARATCATSHPPDLAAAAQEWASRLAKPTGMPGTTGVEFAARLQAASHVQALRPDGNLALARDLSVASRAALALSQTAREPDRPRPPEKPPGRSRPPVAPPLAQPPPTTAPVTPPQFQAALAQLLVAGPAMDAARQRMQAWAATATLTNPGDVGGGTVEPIALAASAEASAGSYNAAAQDDARLAQEVARWSPDQAARFTQVADRSVSQLRDLDAASQGQETLRVETLDNDPAGELAERQRRLAEVIARLERPGDDAPMTVSLATVAASETTVDPDNSTTLPTPAAAPAAPPTTAPSDELAAHRPSLVAAWEARAAADALDELVDRSDEAGVAVTLRRRAAEHQARAVALLKVAMVRVNHREALRRLAEVPALATVFQPSTGESSTAPGLGGAFDRIVGLRAQDWLRAGEKGAAPAPAAGAGDGRAAAPMQDQIQAYFESIAKAQQERK